VAAYLSLEVGWGTLASPIMLRASVLGPAFSILAAIALAVVAVWVAARACLRFGSHPAGRAAAAVVALAGIGALLATILPLGFGPRPRHAKRSRPVVNHLAVVSTFPEDGEVGVPVDRTIVLRLSGDATGLPRHRSLPDVARALTVTTQRRLTEGPAWSSEWAYGTAELSGDGRDLRFTPDLPLLPNHTYTVDAGGGIARNEADRSSLVLDRASFTFTTALQPGSPHRDAKGTSLYFPERIHVGVVTEGAIEVIALPGAVSPPTGRKAPTIAVGAVRRAEEICTAELEPDTSGGSRGRLGPADGCTLNDTDEIVVTVTDRSRKATHRFRPTFRMAPGGRGFVVPPAEAMSIETREGVVIEIPANAVPWQYRINVRRIEAGNAAPPTPTGLTSAGTFALEIEYLGGFRHPTRPLSHGEHMQLATLDRTLRVLVPAPEGVDLDARAYWTRKVSTAKGDPAMALVSAGGVVVHNARAYLGNRPELQPDRNGRTCAQAMADADGTPCLIADHVPELRGSCEFTALYERGRQWALVLVEGLNVTYRAQAVSEASPELIGECTSSATGVLMAVPADRTAEITVTDPATGWQLAQCPRVRVDSNRRSITVVRPL
jgi:hypothetical protein